MTYRKRGRYWWLTCLAVVLFVGSPAIAGNGFASHHRSQYWFHVNKYGTEPPKWKGGTAYAQPKSTWEVSAPTQETGTRWEYRYYYSPRHGWSWYREYEDGQLVRWEDHWYRRY